MQQLKKMGPLGQLLDMIPGMGGMAKEAQGAVDRGELTRVEAIIRSMTPAERHDPIHPQRLPPPPYRRGSGTTLPEVNRLVKQFGEMQKLMKQLGSAQRRSGLPFAR